MSGINDEHKGYTGKHQSIQLAERRDVRQNINHFEADHDELTCFKYSWMSGGCAQKQKTLEFGILIVSYSSKNGEIERRDNVVKGKEGR